LKPRGPRRDRAVYEGIGVIRCLAIIPAVLTVLILAPLCRAYPRGWLKQAACIHRHESTDWHRVLDWRGYPSPDHGGYQIDVSTWAAFAPRWWPRDPALASPAQQTLVAWRIYVANGRRWGGNQWPNSSRECGLR
jgi:hypothetical protein